MIRLWKLGDSQRGILSTKESIDRLIQSLKNDRVGETVDIIWDDMISVQVIMDNGQIING